MCEKIPLHVASTLQEPVQSTIQKWTMTDICLPPKNDFLVHSLLSFSSSSWGPYNPMIMKLAAAIYCIFSRFFISTSSHPIMERSTFGSLLPGSNHDLHSLIPNHWRNSRWHWISSMPRKYFSYLSWRNFGFIIDRNSSLISGTNRNIINLDSYQSYVFFCFNRNSIKILGNKPGSTAQQDLFCSWY